MSRSVWQTQMIEQAERWPTAFTAHFKAGIWKLQDATSEVYEDFNSCATRIIRELRIPHGPTNPGDTLLYILQDAGRYVRVWDKEKKSRFGSSKVFTAVISPLRSALIQYLQDKPGTPQGAKVGFTTEVLGAWQTAAADHNRQRKARLSIIDALRPLKIPYNQWPDYIRTYFEQDQRTDFRQTISPAPFQAPAFDLVNQTPGDWKKMADAAWQLHVEDFLRTRQFWITIGADKKIAEPRRTRGPGKKARNANIVERYKWAALRLLGLGWKEIAARFEAAPNSNTRKSATGVLEIAGWPTRKKPSHRRTTRSSQR
jgi:hypothetical protein